MQGYDGWVIKSEEIFVIKQKLAGTALLIALAVMTFANQENALRPATSRPGQPIYIAAYHRNRYVLRNDLEFETHLKKEFDKMRTFKVTDKLSEAEVVFLAYLEKGTAEGYVLAPGKYTEFKRQLDPVTGQFDLDALREAAYGRYVAGHFKFASVRRISNHLVKKFHEAIVKNINISSAMPQC